MLDTHPTIPAILRIAMKITSFCLVLAALVAQAHAETSLTIYNQNFGVVRDTVPLDLQQGVNQVRFADTTAHLEPDSVILRDPKSGVKLSILEQNYRADPVSSGLLLSLNEGKEIEFFVKEPNKPDRVVKGKVIRSGYHGNFTGGDSMQPVIEVAGQLQIRDNSMKFEKKDAQTIEFSVPLKPGEEGVVTYTVHYA